MNLILWLAWEPHWSKSTRRVWYQDESQVNKSDEIWIAKETLMLTPLISQIQKFYRSVDGLPSGRNPLLTCQWLILVQQQNMPYGHFNKVSRVILPQRSSTSMKRKSWKKMREPRRGCGLEEWFVWCALKHGVTALCWRPRTDGETNAQK